MDDGARRRPSSPLTPGAAEKKKRWCLTHGATRRRRRERCLKPRLPKPIARRRRANQTTTPSCDCERMFNKNAGVRTYVPVERQGERDGTRNETHARASTRLTPRRFFFFLFVAARDGEPGAFCSICNLRNLTTANCRRERGLRNFQGRARHRRRQSETYAGRRGVIFLETGGSTRRIGSAKRSSEGLPIRVAWGDFARG